MAKQYVAEGSNCYHYLSVDKVYSYQDYRYIVGFGKRFFRDLTKPSGYRVDDYSLRVRAEGYLADYVDYEVSPGECIFVIGHLGTSVRKRNTGVEKGVILIAEAIMKPEYLKYFKNKELGER